MYTSGHLAEGVHGESLGPPTQSQTTKVLKERARRTKQPTKRAITNINIEGPPRSAIRVCVQVLEFISVEFGLWYPGPDSEERKPWTGDI